jgi:CRISPR/Cas system CMR-associated protein Cmr5 small subunit
MLITITAVLIFKVIDVPFLTSIKTVDQKSAGLAVSCVQDFHNKKNSRKKYMIFFMAVARMLHVLHMGAGVTF